MSNASKILYQRRAMWHKKAIVQEEGQAPYVQTTFWRQQDAQSLVAVLKETQTRGLALQPLLAQGRDWPWHWVRTGFVSGEAMGGPYLRTPHVQAFAHTLAGLHSLRVPRFGPAFDPVFMWGCTPQALTLARCRWAIRHSQVTPAVQADLLQWLERHGQVLADARTFSLTHGDLKSSNMIWSPDEERAYLIDYGNMRYQWAELELAALLQGKQWTPARQQVFLQTYLAHCPPEVAQGWERNAEAFKVLQLLLSAYRRWMQWRFPLFLHSHARGPAQRIRDMNAFVQRAHELALAA